MEAEAARVGAGQPKKLKRMSPNSRLLSRGPVDRRTRVGQFLASVERQLHEHLGRPASFPERLLITRAARCLLRLEAYDRKANLTDHDMRHWAALENRFRLLLREIGIEGNANAKAPSLADILREHAASKPAAPESGPDSSAAAVPATDMAPDAEMAPPEAPGGLGDG
jgi:hypothetical protein